MAALKEVTLKPGKIIPPAVCHSRRRHSKARSPSARCCPAATSRPRRCARPGWSSRAPPCRSRYVAGALTISATAVTLQSGAAGDLVKVRNIDSGKILSGVVHGRRLGPGRRLMTGLRPTTLLLAFALAASPAAGADMAQDYEPPVPGDAVYSDPRFPPPVDGVPIGQEGAGAYAQFPSAGSQLPQHGASARIKDIASCRARATTSSSATASSSACRDRATACATRPSPSSRSAPCSKTSASPAKAVARAPRTSPP